MSDVQCPYCKTDQEINHDDGYGYEEGESHEQACIHCEKDFKFITSITFAYDVLCQKDDHVMVPFGDRWRDVFECENCDFYEKRKVE